MSAEFEQMRLKELKLFIIEFNKASQLDRSFSKTKISRERIVEFRAKLVKSCLKLMNMIDDGTIKNRLIRKEIDRLKEIDENISYGQAQKVVNVCLKQYCFIANKADIVKELDCPLDTTTMKGCGIKNKTMIRVDKKDYIDYQTKFENNGKCKIYKDLEYDDNRINAFYGSDI